MWVIRGRCYVFVGVLGACYVYKQACTLAELLEIATTVLDDHRIDDA